MSDQQAQAASDADSKDTPPKPPKNIVLCSDGTGNSGGKKQGTNVYRVFNGIDRHTKDVDGKTLTEQVAFYDDGVGTESLKLLKVLGGAFGLGLGRNIVDLYTKLVQVYEPGDRIYLFGFSRGAFTVRSLAGLIHYCGIVERKPGLSDQEIRDRAKEAFKKFKDGHYGDKPDEALAFKEKHGVRITQAPWEGWEGGPKDIPIEFIGVWDTVDAVGVPFDGLRDVLDKIWPIQFKDTSLSRQVHRGCHAVAIDDERKTFHPVMWQEGNHGDVQQVFFAGAHSNVGGGYPRDQLAHLPLFWMMKRAEESGLRFTEAAWQEARGKADAQGQIYDSRSGLKAYYRYKPRDLSEICGENGLEEIKIHESVFHRIKGFSSGYAPINLPAPSTVRTKVVPDETLHPGEQKAPSLEAAFHSRGGAATKPSWGAIQQQSVPLISHRRRLYYYFLATSLCLVVIAFFAKAFTSGFVAETESSGLIYMLAAGLSALVPSILDEPLRFLIFVRPELLVLACITLALLIHQRVELRDRTNALAEAAWRCVFPGNKAVLSKTPRPTWLRVEGVVCAAFLVLLAGFTTSLGFRAVGYPGCETNGQNVVKLPSEEDIRKVTLTVTADEPGTQPSSAEVDVSLAGKALTFATLDPCHASGIAVGPGERYKITVEVGDAWMDRSIKTGPEGFSTWDAKAIPSTLGQLKMAAFSPLRRIRNENWFKLMAQVGSQTFQVGNGTVIENVEEQGELLFFVNDAVCLVCADQWLFYGKDEPGKTNNLGRATITVERLDYPLAALASASSTSTR